MNRLMPLVWLGLVVTLGCGEHLSVDDTETATDEIRHKNASFHLVSESFCVQPCKVMVSAYPLNFFKASNTMLMAQR